MQPLLVLNGDGYRITAVGISPDGLRLVTCNVGGDEPARIWDAETGGLQLTLKHKHISYHGVFSPDGNRILTISTDGTVRIWDSQTGRPICVVHPGGDVTDASFSPDGKRFVTCAATVKLWDASNGNPVADLVKGSALAAFTKDGKLWIATTDAPCSVSVWDVRKAARDATYKVLSRFCPACLQDDGSRYLTMAPAEGVRVYDSQTGKMLIALKRADGSKVVAERAELSPGGKLICTGSSEGIVQIWDGRSGKRLRVFKAHSASVRSIAFSRDGKRLLTCDDSGAKLWDVSDVAAAAAQPQFL